AWTDDAVNAASHDFYRSTLATLEDSWVRPRYSGYIPFQSEGSAIVREVVAGSLAATAGLDALEEAFAASANGPALPFVSSSDRERV
ncbi:MAG: hypothetical protein Q7T71_08395, partial [Herbiconiux sp.]|nr:hypothetical protein [Herbiconiux sp.]